MDQTSRQRVVAPLLPVEVHCHGFADVDFSEFRSLDLARLQQFCLAEQVLCIPTLYLHRDRLADSEAFMRRYAALRRAGRLPHVVRLLVTGAKDDAVARRLGMSIRKCRRYVAELMRVLGTSSRFQAGVEATRRGSV